MVTGLPFLDLVDVISAHFGPALATSVSKVAGWRHYVVRQVSMHVPFNDKTPRVSILYSIAIA